MASGSNTPQSSGKLTASVIGGAAVTFAAALIGDFSTYQPDVIIIGSAQTLVTAWLVWKWPNSTIVKGGQSND